MNLHNITAESFAPCRHGANSGGNDGYDYRSYGRSTLPRGKGLAMRSMEKDRNAAIAAVR